MCVLSHCFRAGERAVISEAQEMLTISMSDLKGSYDVAKKNNILFIWCNAMFMQFKVKKHIIFLILYIIVGRSYGT